MTISEKRFGNKLTAGPVAIGIDQSLTGFAVTVLNVDDPESFETRVYKSEFRGVKRLADIRYWLASLLQDTITAGNQIVDVAMEGTVLASHSALVLGELAATVKLTMWDVFEDSQSEHCRAPLQIPPMTLKKYASGKGNAKKQEMLMQIYKRYGVEFNDDNAADSYGLARLAAGIHIDAVEKAIVEQVKDLKYRDTL
jgi:crossover junction endodeoxyribonuclease RuvC